MEYTLINGTIVDGTGRPGYTADLAIRRPIITAIAPQLPRQGQVIDVQGQVVSPGFIDMHSHSGLMCLAEPRLEPKIHQGITTEVPGVDGFSPAPIRPSHVAGWRTHLSGLDGDPDLDWGWQSFGEYRERLRGTSTNIASMVGHGNLRLVVLGMENRPATAAELRQMCDLLDASLNEGAVGLSTGLIYTPQVYASLEELSALGQVVARHGKFFDFHLRFEGAGIFRAIDEVLEVGRRSGCAVHICHFKMAAREVWGKVDQAVEMIESAQRSGLDVTCDQYPYTAGSTMLGSLLPPWAHEGGPQRLRRLLESSEGRQQLERDTISGLPGKWESHLKSAGAEQVFISSVKSEANQAQVGKSLAQIAAGWRVSPFDALARLLLEEDFAVGMVIFLADESDVESIMRLPWHMFGTDGLLIGKPHPRAFGTYPRILGRYVRERGVLTLEEAVKKSTSVPAARLGLKDRGVLAPGKAADLVVFDPATIIDRATYEEPRQFPAGVTHVFVGGEVVIENGKHTGLLPGHAL